MHDDNGQNPAPVRRNVHHAGHRAPSPRCRAHDRPRPLARSARRRDLGGAGAVVEFEDTFDGGAIGNVNIKRGQATSRCSPPPSRCSERRDRGPVRMLGRELVSSVATPVGSSPCFSYADGPANQSVRRLDDDRRRGRHVRRRGGRPATRPSSTTCRSISARAPAAACPVTRCHVGRGAERGVPPVVAGSTTRRTSVPGASPAARLDRPELEPVPDRLRAAASRWRREHGAANDRAQLGIAPGGIAVT